MIAPILGPDFSRSADLGGGRNGGGLQLGALTQVQTDGPAADIEVARKLIGDIEQSPKNALESFQTISNNLLGTQATETVYKYDNNGKVVGSKEIAIADSFNADGLLGKAHQRDSIDTAVNEKRKALEQEQVKLDKTKEALVNEYRTESDLLDSLKKASTNIANEETTKVFGNVGSFDEVYKDFENMFIQKADLDFDLAVRSFREGGENSQIYKSLVDKGVMSKDDFYKIMSYANKVANIKAEQTNILNGELSPENTRRIYENTFNVLGDKGYNNAQASYLTKMGLQLGVKSLEDSKFALEKSTFENRMEKGMVSLQAMALENSLNESKRHNREMERIAGNGQRLLGNQNQQLQQQDSLNIEARKEQKINENLDIISVEMPSEYQQGVGQAGNVFVRVRNKQTGEEQTIITDPKNINGLDFNSLLTNDSSQLNDKGQFTFKGGTTYKTYGNENGSPYNVRGLKALSEFTKKKGLDLKNRYDNAKSDEERNKITDEARVLLGEIQQATAGRIGSDTAKNYVNLNSTKQEGFVANALDSIGTGLVGVGKKISNTVSNLFNSDDETLINTLADPELAEQINQFSEVATNNSWAEEASNNMLKGTAGLSAGLLVGGATVPAAAAVAAVGGTASGIVSQLENTHNPMAGLVNDENKNMNYEQRANNNSIINEEIQNIIRNHQQQTGEQMSLDQLLYTLEQGARKGNDRYRQIYVYTKLSQEDPKILFGNNAATNFIEKTQNNTDEFKKLAGIDDDYVNKEVMNKVEAISLFIASRNPTLLGSEKAFADFNSLMYKLALNGKLDNKASKELAKYTDNFSGKNIKLYGFNINTPKDILALIRNGMINEMDGSTIQRSMQTFVGLF